ncbi:aldolase [Clostridia bacterium]|nr:aldolase [Clostridia bacterium]
MELKQRLANNEVVIGMMLSELYTPNLARLLQSCGFEYLLVDCEHGYFDRSQVANLIAVADGISLPIWVRIGQHSQSEIVKYLDMGARGVLLANVEGVAEALELTQLCLYAPDGERGVSTFRAHTGYHNGDMNAVFGEANRRTTVIVQIESPHAVANALDILAVPGVDGALIGPNDLTQHLGIIGQYGHPDIQYAIRQVSAAARTCGKWSGVITGNDDLMRDCQQAGMNCFCTGSELSALAAGATNQHRKVSEYLRHLERTSA